MRVRFQVPSDKRVARVVLQPSGVELTSTVEGEWVAVTVPKIWIHEAVVVEWAK